MYIDRSPSSSPRRRHGGRSDQAPQPFSSASRSGPRPFTTGLDKLQATPTSRISSSNLKPTTNAINQLSLPSPACPWSERPSRRRRRRRRRQHPSREAPGASPTSAPFASSPRRPFSASADATRNGGAQFPACPFHVSHRSDAPQKPPRHLAISPSHLPVTPSPVSPHAADAHSRSPLPTTPHHHDKYLPITTPRRRAVRAPPRRP